MGLKSSAVAQSRMQWETWYVQWKVILVRSANALFFVLCLPSNFYWIAWGLNVSENFEEPRYEEHEADGAKWM